MNKTTNQIKNEVEKLIDELELGEFKTNLLDGLRFNYRLKSFEDEDYSQLGNTRLGGIPDLPKEIDYPFKEEGYYNLLCQINFSEFTNKLNRLPEKGILYIFDGHSSENDTKVIFTDSTNNLEKKFPPKGMKNLNEECRESYYEGLKAQFGLEHYFTGNTLDIYNADKNKYEELMRISSKYSTHILGSSMDDVCHVYLYLKGFDTLTSSLILYFRDDEYKSQFRVELEECEEKIKSSDSITQEYYQRKKEQLLKLDKEKEIHFNYYNHVTCLVGLESLDRLGWMWSDMGFKYAYILNEDLENRNFENMWIQWWSS